jgi:rhodanese-related sulfurtransferase
MPTNVKDMMEAANAAVPRITPVQAKEMMAKGNTLVVDVRDSPEVEKTGKIAGAVMRLIEVARCLPQAYPSTLGLGTFGTSSYVRYLVAIGDNQTFRKGREPLQENWSAAPFLGGCCV